MATAHESNVMEEEYQELVEQKGRLPTQEELKDETDLTRNDFLQFGTWPTPAKEVTSRLDLDYYPAETAVRGETLLRDATDSLGLSDELYEDGRELFLTRLQKGSLHGQVVEDVVAASLLVACYKHDTGVPTGAIEEQLDVDSVSRAYRRLNEYLPLMVLPPSAEEYFWFVMERVELSDDVEERARELLAEHEEELRNKSSPGVVAACLYRASQELDERITQRNLADAAHTSCVTIRKLKKAFED